MRNLVSYICLIFLFVLVFAFVVKAAEVPEEEDPAKCLEVLTERLSVENDNAEKALRVCGEKRDEVRKKMFGATVKVKSMLRKDLRKLRKCPCSVKKISLKKKLEILEMAVVKIKKQQEDFKCKER